MTTLGETLRAARQAKGASLEDVEALTKIRVRYVEALEEERFDELPNPVYVRGFLRNYALYLGLDPQEVLALYQPAPAAVPEEPQFLAEPLVASPWLQPARLGAALILLVGFLAFGLWWSRGENRSPSLAPFRERLSSVLTLRRSSPVPVAAATGTASAVPIAAATLPTATEAARPTDTPVRLPTPTATATPSLGVEVSVVVSDTSWVEVVSDGDHVFAKLMNPGETGRWAAKNQLAIIIGNAGGVVVAVNGKRIGVLGAAGEVASREWVLQGTKIVEQVPTPVVTYTPAPGTPPAGGTATPQPSG